MMPFSMNATLINHVSLHSIILSSFYDLSYSSLEQNDTLLDECLKIKVIHPNMVWPYFANIKLEISTTDSAECRNFSAPNVEAKISLVVKNLEKRASKEDLSSIE
jgi:hypothetical protein